MAIKADRRSPELKALRRRFILVQAAKAGAGGALALGFAALAGRPDPAEWVAIAGLLAPALLALLGFTPIAL